MERVKINKAKKEVLVSFNKKFYKTESVDKAILEFSKICDIKRDENGILLKPKEKLNINVLGYEFYNYVLELMKNE